MTKSLSKFRTVSLEIIKTKTFINIALMTMLFVMLFLNFIHIEGGKYSISQIFNVLGDPTRKASPTAFAGLSQGDVQRIEEGIWAALATAVAAVGLALAGLTTQSLTRNPLADASTLGMAQAAVFGIVVAMSFGFAAFYVKFIFALLGGVAACLILLLVVTVSKGRASVSKVVLAGLAIGIIFKTFSFLIRSQGAETKLLNSVSFHYILGGAESVNKVIGNNQWETLYIASGLIAVALGLTVYNSKPMTLLELGEDRAKNLGVKVKTTKAINILIVILAVPPAIMIVGNLAFVGLFSVHIARYFTKSRDYRVILLPAIIFASLSSSVGLYISHWVPVINSGLWMTFIGAPYLIYAGLKGLK